MCCFEHRVGALNDSDVDRDVIDDDDDVPDELEYNDGRIQKP